MYSQLSTRTLGFFQLVAPVVEAASAVPRYILLTGIALSSWPAEVCLRECARALAEHYALIQRAVSCLSNHVLKLGSYVGAEDVDADSQPSEVKMPKLTAQLIAFNERKHFQCFTTS